jgi:hypothetical protein
MPRALDACLLVLTLALPLQAGAQTAQVLPPAPPAAEAEAERIAPLYEALMIPDVVAIMRREGIDYGTELAAELFQGGQSPTWRAMVEEIYETGRLESIVRDRLAAELADADIAPVTDFFTSDLGRRIVTLELEARRAMLDPAVDAAARERVEDMLGEGDHPRIALISDFVEANQLVENNVVGAMNSNFAFYSGLAAGGGLEEGASEEEMLADVWRQEESIRDETITWVYAYLNLAYGPLSDEELQAYVDVSNTRAGQQLNQAVFDAFDEMFVTVSLALGHAASRFLSSQQL